jgi:signal transduction histidine kinase
MLVTLGSADDGHPDGGCRGDGHRMGALDLEQRLAYLNLGEEDVALLAEIGPILRRHADDFVASFYRHLLSFSPTRQLLRDPGVKRRLLGKQKEYLLSLAEPIFDEAYTAERQHIGEVHERIGLSPGWYLGAYALYFSTLVPLVCDSMRSDPERAARTVIALQKLLTLDATLAMETYIDRHQRELEFMADELAREGRQLARDFRDQTAELRHTEQRAQAAEELASIATLVAGLAHEIGTPMGVIQGHAKLLEPAVSTDDARWRVKTIQEQISRISRIIQTLLNMARPRKSVRAPVPLESLLETTLSFVSEKLGRRGIRVVRVFEPVSSVLGDAERLQQLFLNLFLNAADAMPEGGELRVAVAESQEGEAVVGVEDTGTGIPARDVERVFEPFFTTKAAGEGNGLGLMVCKHIVGDHGGRIEVTSTEGEGTRFVVWLPLPGRSPGSPASRGPRSSTGT